MTAPCTASLRLLDLGGTSGPATNGACAAPVAVGRVTPQSSARQAARTLGDVADRQALLDSVNGRPEAFTRLVDRHTQRCLAVARRVLTDEHLAQDSVQEAYLDLWRHAGRHDPDCSAVDPWLVMLTHRRSVDRVRKEQRHPRPAAMVRDAPDHLDLQEQAERTLLGRRAAGLLRELPEAQRRCLVLAYPESTGSSGVNCGSLSRDAVAFLENRSSRRT